MNVLITYGSKRRGTEGIARILAEELRARGVTAKMVPARWAPPQLRCDAVIVGGALYANRWHPEARRFVASHVKQLRTLPVWLFSSGPLDDSAEDQPIAPVPQVSDLMGRIGAQGHVTFGGRLEPNARGFPAAAMAKKHAGDWRHPEHIREWADEIARALPTARPLSPVEAPGHSLGRLVWHAVTGWALCAALMGALLWSAGLRAALIVHGLLAPLIFAGVAWSYFHGRGARRPLPAALAFTGIVLALDGAIALSRGDAAMATSLAGFWLPLAMIFLVTWGAGEIRSMVPLPPPRAAR